MNESVWAAYLEEFHQERPGITARILEQAVDDAGVSPYEWLAAAVRPPAGRLLDLACGSAPLTDAIGVDRSAAELAVAAGAPGLTGLVRADGAALPLPTGAFAAASCSMSLQVLEPLEDVLVEVARVLPAGGVFGALVPATKPLRLRDRLRYAELLVALRRSRLGYPNDAVLRDAGGLFGRCGLLVVDDQRRRFVYRIGSEADAEALVRSLYLPGVDEARVERAVGRVTRWTGGGVGVPLRRLVAVRRR